MLFGLKPTTPNGLSRELVRRIRELKKPVAARIKVPATMKWWFWQEFGVATRRRAVVQYNVPGPSTRGYTIEPVNAQILSFPNVNPSGGGYDLLEDPTNPENVVAMRIPVDAGNVRSHPGYEPRYMVRSVLPAIHRFAGESLLRSLIVRDYNMDQVREDLISGIMPHVLDQLADSFNQNLDNYDRQDGRLSGEGAGDVLRREAEIVRASVKKEE